MESPEPLAATPPSQRRPVEGEIFGRFLTESGHLKPQRRWRGIEPALDTERDRFETSVSRIDGLSEPEIWGLVIEVERGRGKAVIARLNLKGARVAVEQLLTELDEPPVRHHVIIGWPASQNDVDKARRKSIAQALAANADYVPRD